MKKKPDWLYRQSAAIPYLIINNVVNIVLVSSSSKNGWVFPKGVIEKGMSPNESAAKEALEEAGVKGDITDKPIHCYTYEKWKDLCRVKVYSMLVTELLSDWEEKENRERVIVGIDEAIGMVKLEQAESLRKFKEAIEKYL